MNVPHETWYEVFKRDIGYCRYCGIDLLASYSVFQSATVDHIVSVSKNGSDEADNLVLACPACNQMLSRASHLQTFELRKALLEERRKERIVSWYQPLVDELRGKTNP